MHFSNKYRSQKLAEDLDFIMRNQRDFTRRFTGSVRALVQVSAPSTEEKRRAAGWKDSIRASSSPTSVPTSGQMKAGREGRRGAAERSRGMGPDFAQTRSGNEARSGEPTEHGWPGDEEIRHRAYEIYERRGREPGHDLDDWLMAERELIEETASARKRARAAKAS